MLLQKNAKKGEKSNFGITSATHRRDLTKTGNHSLPYLNSFCVKLISMMLKILELLSNERLSVK